GRPLHVGRPSLRRVERVHRVAVAVDHAGQRPGGESWVEVAPDQTGPSGTPQLTLDRAGEDAAQRPPQLLQVLVGVGDLVPHLAERRPGDVVGDVRLEGVAEPVDPLVGPPARGLRREHARDRAVDERRDEVRPVAEVLIDGAEAHPGGGREVGDARALVPLGGELGGGRLEDRLAGPLGLWPERHLAVALSPDGPLPEDAGDGFLVGLLLRPQLRPSRVAPRPRDAVEVLVGALRRAPAHRSQRTRPPEVAIRSNVAGVPARSWEARHPGTVEWFTFDWWWAEGDASGRLGGFVSLSFQPRTVWYWAGLAGDGRPYVLVKELDVTPPRRPASLEIRAEGLWADHNCETAFEHWSF